MKTTSKILLCTTTLGMMTSGFVQVSADTTSSQPNELCVQLALEKREQLLVQEVDRYTMSWKNALTRREEALKKSWKLLHPRERQLSIETAWRQYQKAMDDTHTNWDRFRHEAWQDFENDRRDCGNSRTIFDPQTEKSELR